MQEEKHFIASGGPGPHRLAYMEWGKATSRPPVICVHGLTRNSRDFDDLAKVLARDTKVYSLDVVGRGKSEWFDNPTYYNYAQYLADVMEFLDHIDAAQADWVGTSMGGIMGMLLASTENAPIRKMVVNDVGPFIPLSALKRIGGYVAMTPEFADVDAVEKYLRQIYGSFGLLTDENWRHLAEHSTRGLANGKLALNYDPAIAGPFLSLEKDVDFWESYDKIRCPILLMRGVKSDVLTAEVAQEMTRRGPKARLVEFPRVGHAPALMDPTQIGLIVEFLSG